jgi:hypothetical protein
MLEPYAGKLARTVLRGLGGPQGLPGYPTLSSNPLRAFFNDLQTTRIAVDVAWRIQAPSSRSLGGATAGGSVRGLLERVSVRRNIVGVGELIAAGGVDILCMIGTSTDRQAAIEEE